MSNPSAVPKTPDAIVLNKAIQEFMVARSHQRNMEMEAFAEGANRTDLLIMEVFKGLIASARA